MSGPWFYSESGSEYVALWAAPRLGITNYFGLFLFSGFFQGNPCEDIHPVKTCGIDCRKTTFEQELAFHRPVFLQSSCSDSAECKFEKIWGSKICATVQLAWSTSSYMGNGLSLEPRYSSLIRKKKLLPLWLLMLSKTSAISNTFFRQSLCTVQCILPTQHYKSIPKKCPRNFSLQSYNGS